MNGTLIEQCLALPYWERLNLYAALQGTITRELRREAVAEVKDRNLERGNELLRIMGEIIGGPVDLVTRKQIHCWARTMVAYQMTREGFTTIDIGKVLNKDHSTIIDYRKKMIDVLTYPVSYGDVMYTWKQFQNKVI